MATFRGELSTFVCDGAWTQMGWREFWKHFLGSVGKGGSAPAVWISGFYGSGKSHLAEHVGGSVDQPEVPRRRNGGGTDPALAAGGIGTVEGA